MDITFIKENYLNIIVFVLLFLGFLVLIQIKEWNFNRSSPELSEEIIMETMETMELNSDDINDLKLNTADSFCQSFLNDSSHQDLEGACEKLTNKNCLETSCCVYYNDKCAAGSSDGPTYKSDKDGNPFTIDYYYYQKKCYGKCPK